MVHERKNRPYSANEVNGTIAAHSYLLAVLLSTMNPDKGKTIELIEMGKDYMKAISNREVKESAIATLDIHMELLHELADH